jgi:hypothetical protein
MVEIRWFTSRGQQESTVQDAQNVCPARPQRTKRRRRTLRYVELLSEARTNLADVFSILLKIRLEARRGLIEDRCGGAREGFVVHVVEGIDAELDQAGRQKVEEFF